MRKGAEGSSVCATKNRAARSVLPRTEQAWRRSRADSTSIIPKSILQGAPVAESRIQILLCTTALSNQHLIQITRYSMLVADRGRRTVRIERNKVGCVDSPYGSYEGSIAIEGDCDRTFVNHGRVEEEGHSIEAGQGRRTVRTVRRIDRDQGSRQEYKGGRSKWIRSKDSIG